MIILVQPTCLSCLLYIIGGKLLVIKRKFITLCVQACISFRNIYIGKLFFLLLLYSDIL